MNWTVYCWVAQRTFLEWCLTERLLVSQRYITMSQSGYRLYIHQSVFQTKIKGKKRVRETQKFVQLLSDRLVKTDQYFKYITYWGYFLWEVEAGGSCVQDQSDYIVSSRLMRTCINKQTNVWNKNHGWSSKVECLPNMHFDGFCLSATI